MAKLSREQLNFLSAHEIPLSKVFDCSGMASPVWKSAMKELGMWLAYGGARCAAAGHQLRTRNSDCVQCRPAAIGYLKRYSIAGEVYIAASARHNLYKVGMAQDSKFRIKQLNTYEYGGANDWQLYSSWSCETAGQVEFEAHRLLAPHQHFGSYFKDGEERECKELFKCTAAEVEAAVQAALGTPVAGQIHMETLKMNELPDEESIVSDLAQIQIEPQHIPSPKVQIARNSDNRPPIPSNWMAPGAESAWHAGGKVWSDWIREQQFETLRKLDDRVSVAQAALELADQCTFRREFDRHKGMAAAIDTVYEISEEICATAKSREVAGEALNVVLAERNAFIKLMADKGLSPYSSEYQASFYEAWVDELNKINKPLNENC